MPYSTRYSVVNVRRGSSACIPPVHMSVVVGVVLCVRVVCVGTLMPGPH